MFKFAIGALLCAAFVLPTDALAQCGSTQSTGVMSLTVQSASQNAGIYRWDEAIQGWVLISGYYDPFFENESLDTDDEYITRSAWSGGGGGGGGGGGEIIIQGADSDSTDHGNGRGNGNGRAGDDGGASTACTAGTTLPPVIVTGSRPSFGASLFSLIWRNQILNSFGGGGARRSARSVTANESVRCESGFDDRRGAALDAIRPLGVLRRGTVIRVQYGAGHYQMWVVTQPMFTDRGLQASGNCVGG